VLDGPPPDSLAVAPAARSLAAAITAAPGTAVIAEIKRASPSAGDIAPGLDAVAQARTYAAAGATAISVLTDGPGFGGSLDDLRSVRALPGCPPLLCKDVIVAEEQIRVARAAGADAVLLIVAAIPDRAELVALKRCAESLGMDVLVEVHDAYELDVALDVGAELVGVNNRDLRTFAVDLATGDRLLRQMPDGVVAVAESGIRSAMDGARMVRAGARALLVGEALVRSGTPAALVGDLRAIGAGQRTDAEAVLR
jgi:indole-3-glycerol phosphate synthase